MAGVRAADVDVICSAAAIPTLSIHQALRHGPLRVPLLQRRYCWPERQLRRFLSDATRSAQCDGGSLRAALHASRNASMLGTGHSLGRVVVSSSASGGDGVLVVDGQQRITTAILLLAAIRDVVVEAEARDDTARSTAKGEAAESASDEDRARAAAASLVDDINAVIGGGEHGGAGGRSGKPALVPTYFDRPAMARAVETSDCGEGGVVGGIEGEHTDGTDEASADDNSVTFAKRYFTTALRKVTVPHLCSTLALGTNSQALVDDDDKDHPIEAVVAACKALAESVLLRLTILWFDAREEDVWSVYERLAFREVGLSSCFHNATPGIPLAEADLTRNFLISFFPTEEHQLKAYESYWIPVERTSMDAAKKFSTADTHCRPLLDVLCAEFLKAAASLDSDAAAAAAALPVPPTPQQDPAAHLQGSIFATYKGMRHHVEARLAAAGVSIVSKRPTEAGAAVVERVMSNLASFATSEPWAQRAADAAAARSNWHIINHAYRNDEYEHCGNSTVSAHWYSTDGKEWYWSPQPYSHTVHYDDGTSHTYTTLERPNLHFDSKGQMTHLNVAADLVTGDEGCAARIPHSHFGHCPCDNCKWDDHAGTIIIALDV